MELGDDIAFIFYVIQIFVKVRKRLGGDFDHHLVVIDDFVTGAFALNRFRKLAEAHAAGFPFKAGTNPEFVNFFSSQTGGKLLVLLGLGTGIRVFALEPEQADKKIDDLQNQRIKEHLTMYRQFIDELVKNEGLLDKKIYIVVPYSYLEGTLGAQTATPPGQKPLQQTKAGTFADQAKNALISKRSVIQAQVERMGLAARPLQHEELIKLFYEILNNDTIAVDFNSQDVQNVIL